MESLACALGNFQIPREKTPRSRGTEISGHKPSGRPYYQPTVYVELLRAHRVPLQALALFEELVRSSGRRGYTWVLQSDLADRLGVCRRTVMRWEKALVRAGILTTARHSLWVRHLPGGTRRVAIPHVLAHDGTLGPPDGLVGPSGELRLDGRAVREKALHHLASKVTGVSPERGARPLLKKKRKQRRTTVRDRWAELLWLKESYRWWRSPEGSMRSKVVAEVRARGYTLERLVRELLSHDVDPALVWRSA